MIPPQKKYFFRNIHYPAALILAFQFFAVLGAEAGTWSSKPWRGDSDLPHPASGQVTHAIAFGIDAEPPVPAPFQMTDKISGENWAVSLYPDLTTAVAVTRRPQELLAAIKVKGEGEALLRGRIAAKGKSGGLSLELSGLEAGHKYDLVFFGLAFVTNAAPGKRLVKVGASDVSGGPEVRLLKGDGDGYYVYEYTAPPGGQFTISFEGDGSDPDVRLLRLCGFFNYRID